MGLGKGLLADEGLSTPRLELHSMSVAANICVMVGTALQEWIELINLGGDSEISLNWVLYESSKLDVFVRNRVHNIRAKVPLENVYWIKGSENMGDIGTRPGSVDQFTVAPDSEYMKGK